MKNMRKIVAILAAVLMLCSVMPLGAFAAGDVIVDYNFDDGNAHFERGYVENGYMVFDGTTAPWQNAYHYVNAMKANTNYVVTFKAKADKEATLKIKINNNWAGDTYESDGLSVTTEWQDFELTINSGALTSTALVMFYSPYDAVSAPIYCIDDLKVVEYIEPVAAGTVINGDFETGEANGWNLPQQGGVKAEAAHNGNYGINVKGNGGWGGMLYQTFPVNAGKAYEISLWVKVIATGINIQIKDGDTSGANIAGEWVDTNKAGEWKQFTYLVTPTAENLTINFCGGGNGNAEDVYIDDVTVLEIKEPSFDGYIYNGDFELGKIDFGTNEVNTIGSWVNLWGWTSLEQVAGHNGDYAIKGTANAWQQVYQPVAVTPDTNYTVICYSKDSANTALWIKNSAGQGDLTNKNLNSGSEWGMTSLSFNSGSNSVVWVGLMCLNNGASYTVDDIVMFESAEQSNDGYIINGNFETGAVNPWDNLWGSCPKAEIVYGGMDSNFALEIISGQWKHVRQTNIAVEANTNYKVTAWAKNTSGMTLLVKNGADTIDLKNAGIEAGDEWTEFVVEFNTGFDKDGNAIDPIDSIIFSLMGNQAEAYGIFDNIKIEKIVCEHEYDDCLDADCNLCGETRENVGHNLTYFEAVVAANCQETSHAEYWYCENCGCYFGDAEATWQHNPGWLFTPGECVRPEGAADCAIVPCVVCGNDVYGYGEHDVLICQGGICSKCNAEIEGVGCQNYDTPACQDGVCYYCGGFVAGFGHENGAMEPCVDGECAYGCGLKYPATEDHVDADADDYCDVCWNHLACVDEDGDGSCDVCWSEMPVAEIIYGDADGDGEITLMDASALQQYLNGYEITLNEAAADADGDGEITLMDASTLQQYLNGYDITLGPVEEPILFNDGEITKW